MGTFIWRPDTSDQEFELTHDENGNVVTVDASKQEEYAAALSANQYKNSTLVPAILASLPAKYKVDILDEVGDKVGEAFKFDPEIKFDGAEYRVNLSFIKEANTKSDIQAVVDQLRGK
jgi:hypothetical protein